MAATRRSVVEEKFAALDGCILLPLFDVSKKSFLPSFSGLLPSR